MQQERLIVDKRKKTKIHAKKRQVKQNMEANY